MYKHVHFSTPRNAVQIAFFSRCAQPARTTEPADQGAPEREVF